MMGGTGLYGGGLGMGGMGMNPQCATTASEYFLSRGGVFGRDAWLGKSFFSLDCVLSMKMPEAPN